MLKMIARGMMGPKLKAAAEAELAEKGLVKDDSELTEEDLERLGELADRLDTEDLEEILVVDDSIEDEVKEVDSKKSIVESDSE